MAVANSTARALSTSLANSAESGGRWVRHYACMCHETLHRSRMRTLMILSMALLWELVPLAGWGRDVASSRMTDDRLFPSEEEQAYSAKTPAERVTAFLRIADRKLEAARKTVK